MDMAPMGRPFVRRFALWFLFGTQFSNVPGLQSLLAALLISFTVTGDDCLALPLPGMR
jgi:hypothetical protein